MKILIVEDERLLADSLQALLTQKGFTVECVYDGEDGKAYAETGIYDLLILDVMMPKLDGYEVARQVRANRCSTPILMLTARSSLEDRIAGLNAGADYYLTKPFDSRELLACINALLRRQGNQVDELTLGNTALDLASCFLICGENSIRLSSREFDVMRVLLQSKNSVVSKESILAKVWGYDSNASENHVEVYVGFLRSTDSRDRWVVFADLSTERATLSGLLQTCLFSGAVIFLLFFGVSIFLAHWAVKPVEAAWNQQRQFVADASHELKTPLTVIQTSAELLQNPDCPPENQRRFSNNIAAMSHQMRLLVERLLELARWDSGQSQVAFDPLDFSALVKNCLLTFDAVFFERGLSLSPKIAEEILVSGSQQLSQVVDILLDNAQKYASPKGQVWVTLERLPRGKCRLEVANTGPAISPEELTLIFRRFYRADKARSRDGSFGLGLSIAENLVRQHRGKIWAESENGVNRFFVELPVLTHTA